MGDGDAWSKVGVAPSIERGSPSCILAFRSNETVNGSRRMRPFFKNSDRYLEVYVTTHERKDVPVLSQNCQLREPLAKTATSKPQGVFFVGRRLVSISSPFSGIFVPSEGVFCFKDTKSQIREPLKVREPLVEVENLART